MVLPMYSVLESTFLQTTEAKQNYTARFKEDRIVEEEEIKHLVVNLQAIPSSTTPEKIRYS